MDVELDICNLLGMIEFSGCRNICARLNLFKHDIIIFSGKHAKNRSTVCPGIRIVISRESDGLTGRNVKVNNASQILKNKNVDTLLKQ